MGLIGFFWLENDHFTFDFGEGVNGQEVLGSECLYPYFFHHLKVARFRDVIFKVSFLGNDTVELARGDATTLLAGLRSQLMLDTISFTKFLLRVLVSVCTLPSHAIPLLRSFHLSGFISRLMSLSIISCCALDMSLERCHELLKGHVFSLFFLSCNAELGRLDLDLVLNIECSATIISLKICASEME